MMASEEPVTTVPNASERHLSGTTRTAMGATIDQKMEWVQATPMRDIMSMANEDDNHETHWNAANNATTHKSNLRRSMRETSSISGSESTVTTHAYTDISRPAPASVLPKSCAMSVSRPMGENSDVLKTKAAHVRPGSDRPCSFFFIPFFRIFHPTCLMHVNAHSPL